MADIKIGDVVKLKSGSGQMTVNTLGEGFHGDMVKAVWFSNGELKDGVFHPDALEIVETEE